MAFLWFGRKKKQNDEVEAKKEEEIKKEMEENAKEEHDALVDRYTKARDYDRRVASGENPNTVFDDVYKKDEGGSDDKPKEVSFEEKTDEVEQATPESVEVAPKEPVEIEKATPTPEPIVTPKKVTDTADKIVVQPKKATPKKVAAKKATSKPAASKKADIFDTSKFKGESETGKYVIAYDQGKLTYQFVLKDSKDNPIFTSKVYKAKSSCKNAIKKFVETVKSGSFHIVKCEKTKFKFKLYSKTDRLSQEGEAFASKEECEKNVESIFKCVDSKVSE